VKQISVKLVGSSTDPIVTQIASGVTAGDLLSQVNLAGYVLAIPPAPNRYFASAEAVYDELLDGDFLLAVPKHHLTIDPDEALRELQKFGEVGDGKPAITIDIEEARRELMSLLVIDDEEPMP
jgi:hypothetical protein